MKPPYYFVRDKGSRVAHHWDYERDRTNHALCGHEYEGEILFEGGMQPSRVCRACQEALPRFEAKWWRGVAQKLASRSTSLEQRCATAERNLKQSRSQVEHLTYQLGLSEGRIETLKEKVANQRDNLKALQTVRAAANRAAKTVRDHPAPAKSTTPPTRGGIALIGGGATGRSGRR
jgi:hypothetical protein